MALMIHPKEKDMMFLTATLSRSTLTDAFIIARAALTENPNAQAHLKGILDDFRERYGLPVEHIEPIVIANTNARAYIKINNRRVLLMDLLIEFNKMRSEMLQILLGV